jgi:hypothetical protein
MDRQQIAERLAEHGYIAGLTWRWRWLMDPPGRPPLEGEAGVGKTETAKAPSRCTAPRSSACNATKG